MLKNILLVLTMAAYSAATAQDAQWGNYFSNDELTVSVRYSDCHWPEKGIQNRYLMMRMENKTQQNITVSYDLDRSYNGKAMSPDVKAHTISLAPGQTLESSCDDLIPGLHLYAKILGLEAKSVLSDFALTDMRVNGKAVAK